MAGIPSLRWRQRNPFVDRPDVRRPRSPPIESESPGDRPASSLDRHAVRVSEIRATSASRRTLLCILPIRGRAASEKSSLLSRCESGGESNPTDPSIAPPVSARWSESTDRPPRNSRKIRRFPAFSRRFPATDRSGSQVSVIDRARSERPPGGSGESGAGRPGWQRSADARRSAHDRPEAGPSVSPAIPARRGGEPPATIADRASRLGGRPGIVVLEVADHHVHVVRR